MFVFVLQLRHSLQGTEHLYFFTIFSLIVWLLWALKMGLSRCYRPWTTPFQTTTSVVIPVVDEPIDLFRDVLRRIVRQQPDEILVVINGPRNVQLEAVCAEFQGAVDWTWTPVAGKRNAVKIGVERSTGEITVLVDSDTVWTSGTLRELTKPFADPRVGGVTTKQRILDPQRNILTRWADWLESSRSLYSMPAQSALGQVGCLPGRTIAFRRQVIVNVMPAFMRQRFLGVFLEVSDDRTLTNLTLKHGYRTVYQSTSLVYTDAPTELRKLAKQQFRWAKGSQYNTLRMLPWMLAHAPMLAVFFLADIALPFLLVGSISGWLYRMWTHQGLDLYAGFLSNYGTSYGVAGIVALTIIATTLSMALRHQRHLETRPSDLARMPIFVVISTFLLMPIRLLGFFRMAHAGSWGTRTHAYDSTHETAAEPAPTPLVTPSTQPEPPRAAGGGGTTLATHTALATIIPQQAGPVTLPPRPVAPPAVRHKRKLNPWAAVPYLVGSAVIILEVLYRG